MKYGIIIILIISVATIHVSSSSFNEEVPEASINIHTISSRSSSFQVYDEVLITDDIAIGDEIFVDFSFSGTVSQLPGEILIQLQNRILPYSQLLHDEQGYSVILSQMPMQISMLYLLQDSIQMDSVIISNVSMEKIPVAAAIIQSVNQDITYSDNAFTIQLPILDDSYIITHDIFDITSEAIDIYPQLGIISTLHIQDSYITQNSTMEELTGHNQFYKHDIIYTTEQFRLNPNTVTSTTRSNINFNSLSVFLMIIPVRRKVR